MGFRPLVVCMALLCTLSGCVGGLMGKCLTSLGVSDGRLPSPGPLMKPVIGPPPGIQGCAEPNERLTLSRALWLAQIYNPELAAFSYETRVRDAKLLQAGFKPNPTVSVEVEDFAGTGDAGGSESTQTTVMLSQLIPLGGKISKGVQVAGLDRQLSGWDYEAKRLAVMKEVTRRFVRVLVTMEKHKLAREEIALAEEVLDVAKRRYSAGETSIIDKTRSEAMQATSRIMGRKVGHELAAARQALAAMWGSADPKFGHVVGRLYDIRPVPQWSLLASWISRNPEVARWAGEMSKRWALLGVAEATKVPDLTLGFGVRRINRPDEVTGGAGAVRIPNDTTLVAELAFPLPTFDRNQGNIMAAQTDLAKAEQESRSALVRVQTALVQAYNDLLAAHTEAVSMRTKVIPALQSAFDGIRKAYRLGRIGYLDLLDAQKALIDQRRGYIEAVGSYHNALADLEALIGQPLREMR